MSRKKFYTISKTPKEVRLFQTKEDKNYFVSLLVFFLSSATIRKYDTAQAAFEHINKHHPESIAEMKVYEFKKLRNGETRLTIIPWSKAIRG